MTAVMPELQYDEALPIMAPGEPVRLPRVNLLPPEVIERRAVVRLGQRLGGVVLIAALVGGVIGYEAGSGRDAAQARLDQAQSEGSRLQAERARLAPAQQALTAAQNAQATLKAAMGQEILWSRYLEEVKLKLPKDVRLSNMVLGSATAAGASGTASSASSSSSSTAGSRPVAGAGSAATGAPVATATFTGTATSQYAVADWLSNVALVPGFASPYLTSSTAGGTGSGASGTALVTFTVTVDITSGALSHRYDTDGG